MNGQTARFIRSVMRRTGLEKRFLVRNWERLAHDRKGDEGRRRFLAWAIWSSEQRVAFQNRQRDAEQRAPHG